jgi:hypothetical protein
MRDNLIRYVSVLIPGAVAYSFPILGAGGNFAFHHADFVCASIEGPYCPIERLSGIFLADERTDSAMQSAVPVRARDILVHPYLIFFTADAFPDNGFEFFIEIAAEYRIAITDFGRRTLEFLQLIRVDYLHADKFAYLVFRLMYETEQIMQFAVPLATTHDFDTFDRSIGDNRLFLVRKQTHSR